MSNIKVNLWGREFELEVVYDQYEGESILPKQEDTLNKFIELIRSEEGKKILEEAKKKIIDYIFGVDKDKLQEEITNIFKYVIPTSLYIERTEDKHVIDIMCEYKFDIEHGIAIQFENEQFKKIVPQDFVL